jgi:hypothetical protein
MQMADDDLCAVCALSCVLQTCWKVRRTLLSARAPGACSLTTLDSCKDLCYLCAVCAATELLEGEEGFALSQGTWQHRQPLVSDNI